MTAISLLWHPNSNSSGRLLLALLAVALAGMLATPAAGLIMVGKGNDPVSDQNWPAGSLDVANLKTRLGWWEGPPFGGGETHLLYRSDTPTFQKALDAFAKIKAPKLLLVVHDGGPAESVFLKDEKDPKGDIHYDWSFTVWNPQSWNHLYNNPASQFAAEDPEGGFRESVAAPRLDLYVSDVKTGIDFSKVKVPSSVTVIDERADLNGFKNGSAVIGDVFDALTSKPIEGAKLSLAIQKAQDQWEQVAISAADAGGHFEVKTAPKGSFTLLASADGYAPRVIGYVELRGNTLKRFTVRLIPEGTLSGTALDTEGKPVVGATVRADSVTGVDGRGYVLPTRAQVKTDEKGAFSLTGLPRGNVHLFTYADHFAGFDVMKLYAVPQKGLTIRLTATGAIKGRVTDNAGKPAASGNVSINPPGEGSHIGEWGASGNTAADGTFAFENVPPGEYVVNAMASNPGSAPLPQNAKTITVKAGETVDVEVKGN